MKKTFQVRRTVLFNHCHIVAPATADAETDTATLIFDEEYHVFICPEELLPAAAQTLGSIHTFMSL